MGTRALCSETVLTLLDSGFLDPRATDCDSNTLLHLALEQNNKRLISAIVTHYKGASDRGKIKEAINMQNVDKDTPLHLAARHFARSPLVLTLIDAGAKTGIVNKARQVVEFEDEEEEENMITTTPSMLVVSPIEIKMPKAPPQQYTEEDISSATLPEWLTFEDETPRKEEDDILGPFRI